MPPPPPTRRAFSEHFRLSQAGSQIKQGWFASLSRPIKKRFGSGNGQLPPPPPRRAKSAWDITPSMVGNYYKKNIYFTKCF
ncbi:hypothetical protein O3M35_006552 [Rhynocoris fuscipes]|uniref:Uncharacterized protein n=1 Tax=Rhynocoris fuscipes TaxID=488301 RepID=A0AAW1DFC1_9HEMI